MSDEFEYLKSTLDRLKAEAEADGRKLEPSFFLELENYTLRRGTRRLSEETKKKIVEEVGKDAIKKARKRRRSGDLDAGDVQIQLGDRCPEPWKLCYGAASRVVRKHGKSGEMEIMNRIEGGDIERGET